MSPSRSRPPRAGQWLLSLFLLEDEYFEKLGDFEEGYHFEVREKGRARALLWYWLQVAVCIPIFCKNLMYWRLNMFRNYLKIALRNIKRHKGYSFINLAGLALGMACCILILLWVQDEWSYDRFHEHADDIYRIVNKETKKDHPQHYAVSPIPLAPTLKDEYPEIIAATRFSGSNLRFKKGGESYAERGCWADPDFLNMFSFPLVKGDPKTALSDPFSIIMTRTLARKYFGQEEPLGKVMATIRGADFMITGVMEDVPHNSHMRFDFIIPFKVLENFGRPLDSWSDVSWYTYIMLHKDASVQAVNNKVNECMLKYRPHDTDYNYLQPLKNIHLRSHFKFDIGGHGDIKYVYIFTFTALLILVIACINFMNLATARSARRSREVGIRKVVGANRSDVIRQFFSESIFLSIIAFFCALALVKLFLSGFNALSGKQLALSLSSNPLIYLGLVCIALFAGMLSGSYPALFLSSFQPVKVIKGYQATGAKGSLFRKVLVVVQFSLSIILIVGTLVVYNQVHFMKNKDLGFDKDQVMFFRLRGDIQSHYQTAKIELLQNPHIMSVTGAHSLPIYESSGTSGASWEGKPDDFKLQMRIQSVDEDFLKTFNVKLAQGRFFSRDIPTDASSAFVLNETAVKEMGLKDPIGKRFVLLESGKIAGKIIGVIEDYQLRSLHYSIEPMVLVANPDYFSYLCLKISAVNVSETIAFVEKIWKKHSPQYPFQFQFLDEAVDEMYRSEERVGTIFKYFTFLAVFISCLGLFGLASYMAEQRTKEIGIRKVLGASVPRICLLLSKEFVKCVILANAIAWPIAYFVMNRWLQNFAHRITLGYQIFLLSALLALIIAVLTVSYQSLKAALANPVDSLRYE